METANELIQKVFEIYRWLDEQSSQNDKTCLCCGQCCCFESFGHRLFITLPEWIYFIENHGRENLKQMTSGKCPYQIGTKCSVYKYRFASCRIFLCKGSADKQSALTEETLAKLKKICTDCQIPYRYAQLAVFNNQC